MPSRAAACARPQQRRARLFQGWRRPCRGDVAGGSTEAGEEQGGRLRPRGGAKACTLLQVQSKVQKGLVEGARTQNLLAGSEGERWACGPQGGMRALGLTGGVPLLLGIPSEPVQSPLE